MGSATENDYNNEALYVLIYAVSSKLVCLYTTKAGFLVSMLLYKCDFQKCGILISVDSDESVQSPLKHVRSVA